MNDQQIDKFVEKARAAALRAADRIPLPVHYILNVFFLVMLLGDLAIPDPLPFLDEILGAVGFYYYNVYLLKRTFGVINPLRIIRGESPAAKRRLGLLPWEQQMDRIRLRLKNMKKAAKDSELPGLSREKVNRLEKEVKHIEKRLTRLDRILTRREFQEGSVKAEIARIEARIEMIEEPALKAEYNKAIEHARNHIASIERLRDERNRLVARIERFTFQINDIYSRLIASSLSSSDQTRAARLFDELFTTVSTFDETLKELEAKPTAELYKAAVQEVEQTEQKFRTRHSEHESTRT